MVDSADPNLGYHNPVTEPQLKIHFLPPLPALRTRNPTTHYLVEGQIHRGWNLLGASQGFRSVLDAGTIDQKLLSIMQKRDSRCRIGSFAGH